MWKTIIFKIALWALLIFVFLLWIYRSWSWIINPICNKMEEWGTVNVVNCLLQGGNPYDYSDQIQHSFIYGPLFPIICSYLYQAIGIEADVMIFCRVVNFILAITISVIFYYIVYKFTKNNALVGAVSGIAVLPVVSQSAPITAYSVSLGVFITSIILLLSLTFKVKSYLWGVVYALLIVLAFFCKQYFVIICIPLGLQMLKNNKRLLISYLISLIILSVATYIFLMNKAPLCLYILLSCQKVFADNYQIMQMIKQWVVFGGIYLPFFIAIGYTVYKKRKSFFTDYPILLLSYIALSSIALLKLGQNIGAYLDYFQHLLLMPLLILGLACINNVKNSQIKMLLLISCLVFPIGFGFYKFTPPYNLEKNNYTMKKLESIKNSVDKRKICNFNPMFDNIAYNEGWYGYNSLNNLSIMKMTDQKEVWLFNDVHKKLLPIITNEKNKIRDLVEQKEYDVILFRKNFSTTEEFEALLISNYVVTDSFDVQWGHMSLMNYVLRPIKTN